MNAYAELRFESQEHRFNVDTRIDEEYGVYWAYLNPRGRACISPSVLRDLQSTITELQRDFGCVAAQGSAVRIRYGVIASRTPGIFSLGGDLALFRDAIMSQNREVLLRYGKSCCEVLLAWHRNCEVDMTTISLVQGEALGGGFEGALSASVLVAEESARLGFPEILFNLFPGMGAFSFLSRKVGRSTAERLITSGTIYTARELYDMGVVDVLTADGTGEEAVYSYIKKHAKLGNGRRAFEKSRNECDPITIDEMMRVMNVWVDAALKLEERDLRLMERLVRAQQRTENSGPRARGNVIPLQPLQTVNAM
ncbi:MAG TPA: crotonase/enoyl-CoA hydratase family protein [Casimicrobiaceae bacterium]|nr:crotonase/enoyl-CoA hydratase family protein [Casimicrobiaceae bacterium]